MAILARILGPEVQGIFTVAILLPVTLYNLFNFGFPASTVYFVGKKQIPIKEIYKTNVINSQLLAACTIVIGIFIRFVLNVEMFAAIPVDLYLLVLLAVPFIFINYFTQCLFVGQEDFVSYNWVILIQQIVFFCGILLLVWVFDLNLKGAILSYLIAEVLKFIGIQIFISKKALDVKKGKYSTNFRKEGGRFGLKLFGSNILAFLNYRSDLFLISYFLDFSSVGIYGVAVGIVERLWLVSSAVSSVLYSRISNLRSEEQRNEITTMSTRNTLFITLILMIVLIIIIKKIILLVFGAEYMQSADVFYFLLPGIIAGTIAKTVANDFSGRGKPEINLYISFIAVVLNVVLNIMLIPKYGIYGAAIATSISYSINALIKVLVFCRIANVSSIDLLLISNSDIKMYRKFFNTLSKGGRST